MKSNTNIGTIISWIFAILLLIVGILNLTLIHPVPGLIYIILSLVYFPPVNTLVEQKLELRIHPGIKIMLGVIIFFFTLGVSDLAEMYGI